VTEVSSPGHARAFSSVPAATGVGRITRTAIEVPSIVLFIALGSGARGRAFG
jgi:hypothetical protein